jgi:hypothetical protein
MTTAAEDFAIQEALHDHPEEPVRILVTALEHK